MLQCTIIVSYIRLTYPAAGITVMQDLQQAHSFKRGVSLNMPLKSIIGSAINIWPLCFCKDIP